MQNVVRLTSPETFFRRLLPNALAHRRRPIKRWRKICVVRLFGDEPATWTIDLWIGRVAPGAQCQGDLYLEMDGEDFSALMAGGLDVAEAVQTGRIRFDGDLTVLEYLGEVLAG